jgi:hypothetical protein
MDYDDGKSSDFSTQWKLKLPYKFNIYSTNEKVMPEISEDVIKEPIRVMKIEC